MNIWIWLTLYLLNVPFHATDPIQHTLLSTDDTVNISSAISQCNNCVFRHGKAIGLAFGKMWDNGNPLKGLLQWISGDRQIEGRRRLPFMLPVMYNLGVITTLLVVLTVLTLKGLTIGIILLIASFGKKAKLGHHEAARPIHIHLHGGPKKRYPSDYYQPYTGLWDRYDDEDFNGTLTEENYQTPYNLE